MQKFKVYIERENKNIEVSLDPSDQTIRGLLKKLNLNPVAVIVTVNNEVCVEEEKIKPKDAVKVISVVSGG